MPWGHRDGSLGNSLAKWFFVLALVCLVLVLLYLMFGLAPA